MGAQSGMARNQRMSLGKLATRYRRLSNSVAQNRIEKTDSSTILTLSDGFYSSI